MGIVVSEANSVKQKMAALDEKQKKTIKAWCVYDWANSAFSTSVTVAILPIYAMALTNVYLDNNPDSFFANFSAAGMWAFVVGVSTGIVALSSPILGVLADRMEIKTTLLRIYTIVGAIATILMFFSAFFGDFNWLFLLGCFFLANIGFAGANVFYNALLPYLGEEDLMDEISSRGFAWGYIGGGLLLAIHFVMLMGSGNADWMIRLSLASVGIWWWGFSIYTFRHVPEPEIEDPLPKMSVGAATKLAFSELKKTFKELSKFKVLVIYLLAYLMFNDGIQTVLSIAGAFGGDVLGVAILFNMLVILIIQFVAAPSAMIFSKLAERTGTKNALIVTLVGWCLVIALAVGFVDLEPEEVSDADMSLTKVDTGWEFEFLNDFELNEDLDSHMELEKTWGLEDGAILANSSGLRADIAASDLSLGIVDGDSAEIVIGEKHRSQLGDGSIDWWPETLRENVWKPLGLGVNLQWLVLGLMAGMVMGGSQALARSMFGMMVPETRSTEFFGFFGFIGKAASVIGPMLYFVISYGMDDRLGVLSILFIIVIGTIMMKWVDVEEGIRVAKEEDASRRGDSIPEQS